MNMLMMYVTLIIDKLYSLWFCMKCFSFSEAVKIPVNISHKVSVENVHKGCIVFDRPIRGNMLYVGHQGASLIADQSGVINIDKGCTLIIKGHARMAQGIRLWIEDGAVVTLGDNFYCNKNCVVRANRNITIGKDVLLGWNIEMNTTDGHLLYEGGRVKENSAPIMIGDKVWIASYAIVSKGAVIGNKCVVAQRSVVTNAFEKDGVLLGGTPAKVIKENVDWDV